MRALAALVTVALLVVPAAAVPARVDDDLDAGWLGDEPDSEGGALPSARGEADTYAADDGPYADALAGTPVDLLAVEWVHRGCAYGVACADASLGRAAAHLLGGDMILPGAGRFEAWYGTFADVDRDGWIRPGNRADENVHMSAARDCGGATGLGHLHGADAYGLGSAQGFRTGVALRCPRAHEWTGKTADIVAYVTPGDWDGADVANRAFDAWDPFAPAPSARREAPDLAFKPTPGHRGEVTGRYHAPASGADLVMLDQSTLETTVVEAFSDPVATLDGRRTMARGPVSLADVDVRTSVDPGVEALYQDVMVSRLDGAGCDVARPERGCRTATDPLTEPLRASSEAHAPFSGPALAPFLPPWERDPQGLPRDDVAPYLDLFIEASLGVPLVKARVDASDALSRRQPARNAHVSANGDGEAHATPHVAVMARLGTWTDVDGDGWIGSPRPAEGCPDVHDCGATPDPHDYASSEFAAACGRHETPGLAKAAAGSFFATLAPRTGSWGLGVYVLTDRKEADPRRDPLAEDGSAAMNPYDDVLLAPRFVFAGPVTVTLTCSNDAPGLYRSYERLVFLEGSNLAYDILIEGGTTLDVRRGGIDTALGVSDVDDVRGWL